MTSAAQPISDDSLDRLRDIIIRTTAAGHYDVAAEAADWLDRCIRQNATLAASAEQADPVGHVTPACAEDDDQPESQRRRKLRKGRTQCTATRRDGERCEAPAMAGGVCRRHGGAAPQTLIAEGLRIRQVALLDAIDQWQERGDVDSLGKVSRARRELDEYAAKVEYLGWLRREQRQFQREQAVQASRCQPGVKQVVRTEPDGQVDMLPASAVTVPTCGSYLPTTAR